MAVMKVTDDAPKDIAPVVVAAGRIVDTHSSIFAKVLQKNSEISKF